MNPWKVLKKLLQHPEDSRDRQRIAVALAKAAATRHARAVDLSNPASWEFSGFSQNGEDGVLDVLRGQMRERNRRCVEVGSGDGVENNTAWLMVAEQYAGLMVEGNAWLANRTRRNVTSLSIGSECRNLFVTTDALPELVGSMSCLDPDVFSLDIDGNDYHIMKTALGLGLRPRIIVVEFNSVFGPDEALTIEYQPDFVLQRSHPSQLCYGVSIMGWRRLLEAGGYCFVTVEQNGVNAFFVDPSWFDPGFLTGLRGLAFAENRYQLHKFRAPSHRQFELIAGERFLKV